MKSKRGKINNGVSKNSHNTRYKQPNSTLTSLERIRDGHKEANNNSDDTDCNSQSTSINSSVVKLKENGSLAEQPTRQKRDKRSSKTLVSQEMLNAGTLGGMFGSVTSTKLLASVIDDKRAVEDDIYKNFDFPFENLILEGGGNKGMAYVGALEVYFLTLNQRGGGYSSSLSLLLISLTKGWRI